MPWPAPISIWRRSIVPLGRMSWICAHTQSDFEGNEMIDELINAEFSRRIVIRTDELPWIPSPQAGVSAACLIESAVRSLGATSLFATLLLASSPPSMRLGGIPAIDGIFSDEHGDYPAGTYVRNPPGSRHSPRTWAPAARRQVETADQEAGCHRHDQISLGIGTSKDMPGSISIRQVPVEKRSGSNGLGRASIFPRCIARAVRRYLCCPAISVMMTGTIVPTSKPGWRCCLGSRVERRIGRSAGISILRHLLMTAREPIE